MKKNTQDMVVFFFLAKKSLSCSESVTNTDYDSSYKLSWLVWVNGSLGEWKGGDGKDDARQQPDELPLLFWMHEKP